MLSTIIGLTAFLLSMQQLTAQEEGKQEVVAKVKPARSLLTVRMRTVDAAGKRLAGCQVYFVQADAGRLRPAIHPKPLVANSNARGLVSASLPVGHSWRVFAWTKGSEGPMATAFVELARLGDVRDLALRPTSMHSVLLKGLSEWRRRIPKGLKIKIEWWGLMPIYLPLPPTGVETIELPPWPREPFSVSLEHEKSGTVEFAQVATVHAYKALPLAAKGVLTMQLGQPVRLAGTVKAENGQPVAGAQIRLRLPDKKYFGALRPVSCDAQGRFECWVPWQPGLFARAPELLVSAPGHLLRIEPLRRLYRWISDNNEERFDPSTLDGVDMARARVIPLTRAHRLDWSVKGRRPGDQFFLRVRLTTNVENPRNRPFFILPLRIDDAGGFLLPGDLHVDKAVDQVSPALRSLGVSRDFEVYLVRGGFIHPLYFRGQEAALPQQQVFDLRAHKFYRLQVRAEGRPVSRARVQLVQTVDGIPVLSPRRMLGTTGSFEVELPKGELMVLAESDRKGMTLDRIKIGDQTPKTLFVDLVPYREVRIQTSHPDPKLARFPMQLLVRSTFKQQSALGQHMLETNDHARGIHTLHSLPREIPVRISSLATRLGIMIHNQTLSGNIPRPRMGAARFALTKAGPDQVELRWR